LLKHDVGWSCTYATRVNLIFIQYTSETMYMRRTIELSPEVASLSG